MLTSKTSLPTRRRKTQRLAVVLPMGSPDLYNPIAGSRPPLKTLRLLSLALSAALLLALVAVTSFLNVKSGSGLDSGSGSDEDEFPWTQRMLTWQRAGFHFRTVKNYMTDPCGPMYHKGWYHLFYQHNPNYSFWDYTMSWGHAVSRDLLNWYHLPVAIQPDHWYDVWGDWTGSIMRLSDGRIVLLYTGITGRKEAKRQVINVATADDPSDPLLLRWSKYEGNPVLLPPPGIEREDFRDPSPFWYNSSDSTWYLVFGSRNESLNHAGIALVYTTRDFISFNLLPHYLHFVEEIGMWECVELYPVAAAGPSANRGLDPFVMPGENVKHVLKSSVNDEWHDYYAIGTFDTGTMTWTPDDETVDVGMGMRYDWGKFYASRTFYDQMKQRRILWGYVGETDSQNADIQKGWASFQALPREVLFDLKTGSNLLTWPVEEVKSLCSLSLESSVVDCTLPFSSLAYFPSSPSLPLKINKKKTQLVKLGFVLLFVAACLLLTFQAMDPKKMSGLERLAASRRSLRLNLDRSHALSAALARCGPRLDEIHQRLPSLEAAVRPIRAHREALSSVAGHIDRAVGPAAAVLKVFDAVHGLERPLLSDPRSDLPGYLSVLTRLEEALRFLSDNCALAVQWLDDIVDYLDDNSVADSRFLSSLKSSLSFLKSNPSPLDGGLLNEALSRLEAEFRRLLEEHSVPLPMSSSSLSSATIAPSPLPVSVVKNLAAILERMIANDRLDRCVSIYIEVRGSNVRASLKALDLDYLEISVADFNDVQSIEGYIEKWGKHLEFAVKHLFEAEYKLCSDVFERAGPPEVWTGCFAEIAAQAGILAFLRFGKTVTESKKDPIKLLKLLDIFSSLNKLRVDFNRLFGGKACVEIQNETRDLIKRVIEGSCEIFWELLVQVELQRQTPGPLDGAVPKLVSFITDYCNRLLGEDYRPVLTQVLSIHRSWQQQKFQERLLVDAILNIMKALEVNFETWFKGYEDQTLSYLFMMNTHWHFFKHLKGTKLGELLGDPWLREHEQYKEYYAACYLRESWSKLPSLLSREGLILFSGGRATARDLVKKRLKAFNETFDGMYQKQSNWVISDKDLRERTCQLIIQAIVPVYRSYMQNYGPLVEQDASASKYAKYSAQALEKMVGSLFQQKPGRSASFRVRHSNGKLNSVVSSQYRSAPTVI